MPAMQLLHESTYFKLRQCDLKRCFLFETEHKTVHLTFCQLLGLRKNVRKLDLEAHFDEEQNKSGIDILIFCNREHVLILDTYQIIDLKDFMEEAFAILECAPLAQLEL